MTFRVRRAGFPIFCAIVALLLGGASGLDAASYLPLSDADLARKSPVIVRAEVLSTQVRHATAASGNRGRVPSSRGS